MISLANLCYENITGPYWYAWFGDSKLIIDQEKHCFNATKLCHSRGKKLKHWLKIKGIRRWVETYQREQETSSLPKVIGGKSKQHEDITGTYVPNDMLLGLALWISVDVYRIAFKTIEASLRNQNTEPCCVHQEDVLAKEQAEREHAQNQLETIKRELGIVKKELDLKKRQREQETDDLVNKNKKLKQDEAPKRRSRSSQVNVLSIVLKNKADSCYPYYVIRCRKKVYHKTLAGLKERFPNLAVVHEIRFNSNVVNLFNRMKEYIPYMDTMGNDMTLEEGKLELLKSDIDKLILLLA